MKHNAGPWNARPFTPGTYDNGARIYCPDFPDSNGIAHVYSQGSTEANARLIAAAPELLECLEFIAEESTAWANSEDNWITITAREWIKKAATGEGFDGSPAEFLADLKRKRLEKNS